MKRKALFMETTMIDASKTVAEIQVILGKYGASAVATEYEGGEVSSVSFRINVNGAGIPFRLPCRWQKILEHIYSVKYDPTKHNVQKCPDAVNKSRRVA